MCLVFDEGKLLRNEEGMCVQVNPSSNYPRVHNIAATGSKNAEEETAGRQQISGVFCIMKWKLVFHNKLKTQRNGNY